MANGFDPYYTWLGIPPAEQPPHHYRLLGLTMYESNGDVIAHAADRQMAHVKAQATGQYSAVTQKILTELSRAKICLLQPHKKGAYDARLREQFDQTPAVEEESEFSFVESLVSPGTSTKSAHEASYGRQSFGFVRKAKLKTIVRLIVLAVIVTVGYRVFSWVVPKGDLLHFFHKSPDREPAVAADRQAPPARPNRNPTPKPAPKNDPQKFDSNPPGVAVKPESPPAAKPPKESVADTGMMPPDPFATAFDSASAIGLPGTSPPPPLTKSPVPDDVSRRAAELAVGEGSAALNAPDLLKKAERSSTPGERYVLLRFAQESAARAGQFEGAWNAAKQLVQNFEVDDLETRSETLLLFQPASVSLATCRTLAERAIATASDAVGKNRWDVAERLAVQALISARRVDQFDLIRQATLKVVECQKAKSGK